ncbi:MAG TPA: YfcE family phosphodiesterase [Tepidiformaceae bacterium]|nr:YfcE family phosphodiesterase [Tepidiformaceae bacterium]
MRIVLLGDTHLPSLMRSLDELGPEPADALRGADLILHAGDVTIPAVLDWCGQFAPVLVAEGNNDLFRDPRMAARQIIDVDGWRIGMAHELRPESRPMPHILATVFPTEPIDILIGGDTHVERLEYRDDVLLVNPGSPILPHHLSTRLGSLAVLDVSRSKVRVEVLALGETPGLRNPTRPQHVTIERGAVLDASLDGLPLDCAAFLAPPSERPGPQTPSPTGGIAVTGR